MPNLVKLENKNFIALAQKDLHVAIEVGLVAERSMVAKWPKELNVSIAAREQIEVPKFVKIFFQFIDSFKIINSIWCKTGITINDNKPIINNSKYEITIVKPIINLFVSSNLQ